MNLDKLNEILKIEFGGETYFSLREAEELLKINLDDAEYIEITITDNGKPKKNKFVKSNSFDKFIDDRELSDFNKLLKKASTFNPNK